MGSILQSKNSYIQLVEPYLKFEPFSMPTIKQTLLQRTWVHGPYFISTDPSLISIPDLNAAFATDVVYWANPLPENLMRETLDNSLCFGLYDTKPTTQMDNNVGIQEMTSRKDMNLIGFARCVTDFSTFSYLTDVYVLPSHQGEGLGKWVMRCVDEVHNSMPFLRRTMLFTSDWARSVPFYKKMLHMEVVNGEDRKKGGGPAIMQKLGPGIPASLR